MKNYISPPKNLADLADFLEEMNKEECSHIGYCGENNKEIYDTLINDFSDIEVNQSIVVAYFGDRIVGALGFDIDEENKSAEVWVHLSKMGKSILNLQMYYGMH